MSAATVVAAHLTARVRGLEAQLESSRRRGEELEAQVRRLQGRLYELQVREVLARRAAAASDLEELLWMFGR